MPRAVSFQEYVQRGMQILHPQPVRQFLRFFKVIYARERVVGLLIGDTPLSQLCFQPVVPVEIKVHLIRRNGRHTDKTQPEFPVNEVEIVRQAFGVLAFEIGTAPWFIMPRLRNCKIITCEVICALGTVRK